VFLEAPLYLENIFGLIVELAVDTRYLAAPALTLHVAELLDLAVLPVHIIADERHFLIDLFRRICHYSPASRKFTGISIG